MGERRPAFFHGGKAGLRSGQWLVPSPPHVTDGCPVCVARASGRVMTVGEYREWAQTLGPRGEPILRSLRGAHPAEPVDPPSAENAVYVTTDRDYATWYAARSRGDLYLVAPAELTPSTEDHFPSFTTPTAQILAVIRRKVRLTVYERRRLDVRWALADRRAAIRAATGEP